MDAYPFLIVAFTGISIIALSMALDRIWAQVMPFRSLYYFIRAPGVIVHECAHITGCILTGAKIRKVVLFHKGGGSVFYSPPLFPYIGDVIISTAPFILIPLVLAGLTWIFGTFFGCILPLHPMSIESAGVFQQMLTATAGIFAGNLYYQFNGWFFLYLYFTLSLVLSLAPSTQDIKNAAVGICIIIITGLLIIISDVPFLVNVLAEVIHMTGIGFSLGLAFELIATGCSLPFLIWYGLKKSTIR
jgi:hypothetical protein